MKIIVLSSGNCSWGRCIFCGWGKGGKKLSVEELKEKFQEDDIVKIFCSGSFFDENQYPLEFQKYVAEKMRGKTLYIESRVEHITKEKLELFKGVNLIVSIGLEAADDEVLKKLNKGLTIEKFKQACDLVHSFGFKVKAYILVNPPYDYPGLLEKTIKLAKEYCDEFILINTYPHQNSKLLDLWLEGKWRPLDEKEFYEKVGDYPSEFNNYNFIPKIPKEKQVNLVGVGVEYIDHPHFNVWQDYIIRFYKVDKEYVLFHPCSKKKPYYLSRTHKSIKRVISGFPWFKKINFIVISNPGVIPIELSNYYPFNAYDWDERLETPEVMKKYIEINKKRIKEYLKRHKYKKIFSYFKPESESGTALKMACKELGINLIDLVDKETYEKVKNLRNPLIHPLMLKKFKEKLNKEMCES